MVKLTSTYNFARISKHIYVPKWQNKISLDRPFSDGEDGIIEVQIRNVSPLFTRDGFAVKYDKKSIPSYSAHYLNKEGKRLYYLPASSVKGMLRMTLEAISFGRMNRYLDRSFGYRVFQTESEYMSIMKDVKCGWLEKDGDDFILTPCKGPLDTISISELSEKYPSFDKEKSAWRRNQELGFYPLYNRKGQNYHIVSTGKIDNKKNEFLFPVAVLPSFRVPDDVALQFLTIHNQTPDFDEFMHRIEGNRIAVFYIPDDARKVKAIGMSKMIKYPRVKSLKEIVETQQEEENGKDLAECIFGLISSEPQESLRGRIHIGNAFSEHPLADDQLCQLQKGVLSQPKPSFYPLYLKQDKSPYKTYDDPDGLAGRKFYRIHKGNSVTQLPNGNNNENQTTEFYPVPEGQIFNLRIAVHNLRPIEIGALLSAMTLHETQGCFHNLGLAKGFGYGKLEIVSIRLSKLSQEAKYYMRVFEQEMSSFTLVCKNKLWSECEEVTSLLQVLSEHDDNDVMMMRLDLKDFREISKNSNFDVLKEPQVKINSLLGPEHLSIIQQEKEKIINEIRCKKVRYEFKDKLKNACNLLEQEKLKESEFAYRAIESQVLMIYGIQLPEVQEAIKKIDDLQEEKERNRIILQRKEHEEKQNKGFDAFINEINLHGEYKVKEFKICNQKTTKWMKDHNRSYLTDEEKQVFANVIKRLVKDPSKKEKKAWNDKNSVIWKTIIQYLGDDWQGEPL